MATESPVIQLIAQRTENDCVIATLAMYLGLSYEDVLVAAAQIDQKAHHRGLYVPQIERVAKILGVRLRRKKTWDLEMSEGILSVEGKSESHVVVLKAGLIFDTNSCVWEPSVYFLNEHYTPMLLLQRRG